MRGVLKCKPFVGLQGPFPSPMHGGPKGSGEGGHTGYLCAHVCGVCRVPFSVSVLRLTSVSDKSGKKGGEFGQRDKLCRETVWDAGNKKASENASHKQLLASLRLHSYKTPAPPTPANSSAQPACRPAFCSALRPAAARRHGLPGDCRLVPSQNLIPFLLLTTKGGKHLLRQEEGPTVMICHLYKVSRTTAWRW